MKRIKVLLATLLVFAMMAPMAMAEPVKQSETTSIIGVGTYANPATTEVWSITFPTASAVDFTVDPGKLISASNRFGDDVSVSTTATVLFPNYDTEGALTGYDDTTSSLEVINKGSTNVTVELNVRPTNSGLTIAKSTADLGTLTTDPAILFEGKVGTATTLTGIPAVGENFTADLAALANGWETKWDAAKQQYTKALKEDVDAESAAWSKATFSIKGSTNATDANMAAWKDELTPPNLKLTWNVRNQDTEAIAIDLSGAESADNYTMKADCIKATPGQIVNVYIEPKRADTDSPTGYVVTKGPSGIETSVKNYESKPTSISDPDAGGSDKDKYCSFSNIAESDNGTYVCAFIVPSKGGLNGFSSTKKNGDPNTISVTGGPTINKKTFDVALGDQVYPAAP